MALNFPLNPTVGQVYTVGSESWQWDGHCWGIAPAVATYSPVHIGQFPPSAPIAGDLWWNSTTGTLCVYYTDTDGSQWVSATQVPDPNVTVTSSQVVTAFLEELSPYVNIAAAVGGGVPTGGLFRETGGTNASAIRAVASYGGGGGGGDTFTILGVGSSDIHLGAFSGSTITDNVTVKGALQLLETSLELLESKSNVLEIDQNVNDLISLIGMGENVTNLGNFSGTTINDNVTLQVALQQLETKIEAEAVKLVEIDGNADSLIALSGVIENSSNLGSFNGTSITTNGTIKAALQELESAVEARVISGNLLALLGHTSGDLHFGTFTGSTLVDSTSVKSHLQTLETAVESNDSDIALRATLASPTFTGVPKAPNAAGGTSTDQIATCQFVQTEFATLIDSAPGALNTLNELAAALGDDANFSTTITNMVNANETHIDNVVTLSGVAKDAANLGTFTGSTVADGQTIKAALQALETKVEAVQTDVDGNESDADAAIAAVQADVDQNEADADAAIAAVQADVDANESAAAAFALGLAASNEAHIDNVATLTGVAKDGVNFGTFTGSTIADNQTLKDILQSLETDTEGRLSKLGGILAGDLTLRKGDGSAVALRMSRADHPDMSCEWKIQPSYVSSTKEVLTVLANGQVVAHFDERQRFAINMTDPDYTLDVGGDGHFSTNLTVGGNIVANTSTQTGIATHQNHIRVESTGNLIEFRNTVGGSGIHHNISYDGDNLRLRGHIAGGEMHFHTGADASCLVLGSDQNVTFAKEARFSNNYANKAAAGTGAVGDVAVIGGKLCFHDGTDWKEITLGSAPA